MADPRQGQGGGGHFFDGWGGESGGAQSGAESPIYGEAFREWFHAAVAVIGNIRLECEAE